MTMIGGSRSALAVGLILMAAWRAAPAQQPAAGGASVTPATIALGDSVFHGKAGGGTCYVCHGVDAKGTPGLAPELIKAKWLHGDGSLAFLTGIVQQGVANPKEAPAAMPPMGGAKLSDAQVEAVAAYVYSLNHPTKHAGP